MAAALALVALGAVAADNAPPLPAPVTQLAPALTLRGGGEFTFFGISVYDGWYWSARDAATDALDLHYHLDLSSQRIAARSIDEIAKLGYGSVAQRERWRTAMSRVFPDVRRGDRLTGVRSVEGVRFFHNGRFLGSIDDAQFATAFFGIWLDPRTSRADFRERLLGVQ